tara:strand:- start:95 stop:712 length:618 start_codon:yes stop_codon:yes gene_type:complete
MFARLCKLYKTEKKPKDSQEIIDIQNKLLKKAQEEAAAKREAERLETERIEQRRKKDRDHYAANREKIKERRREYYNKKLKDNPIHIEKQSKYRIENRDMINKKHREKHKENVEKGIKRIRPAGYYAERYQRNKEEIKVYHKKYQKNNKEKRAKISEKWYYRNRREICKRARIRYTFKKMIKKIILKRNFIYLKKCLSVINECPL